MQSADIHLERPLSTNVMNHDDDMVLGYLRKFPNAFVSAMEVCKRAGDRRRFASQPDGAKPVLVRLTQQGVLECNVTGQYRIKPAKEEEPQKHGRPYEPRPEPPAPPAAAVTEPKVEVTVKPETSVQIGEKEKAPTIEMEAKKDSAPQVDDCKNGKVPTSPASHGHYSPETKKAA